MPAARMCDSAAGADGYVRPSLLTDFAMGSKALGSGAPTASMRTRRPHRRGYCAASDIPMKPPIECPITSNESAPYSSADLQEIADVAVPTVGTGWGDVAAATTTQIHGDDVVARLGQYRHESIERSAIGR